MNNEIKNYLGAVIIAGIALLVIASFWYVSSFSKSVIPQRTFSASGEGKVVAVPDVIQLSFGVLTEGGKNLANLQKENTDKVNRIIAFLKENGVEEKDIKTQFYNITPRHQYFVCPPPVVTGGIATPAPCPPSEIVGYTINQSVSVKIRDKIRELNKAGDIVAGVVDNGANIVSNLSFTVDDPTEPQNQARAEAITEAREKAKTIAKAGGFRLGKLISLQEQEGVFFLQPVPSYALGFDGKGGGGFAGSSIEPGSQEIRVNVTLVYEIK
jgi:hypothetical protein